MNAYDLANHLAFENIINDDSSELILKAIDMLRQQADRITELEGEVSNLKHINKNWQLSETMAYNRIAELEKLVHQRFDDGKRLGVLETENKFKSPPCAWMVKTNDGKKLMLYGEEQPPKFADEVQAIPLYTTPQTKPLSDEEIKQIWYNLYPLSSSSYWDDKREGLAELKFARAIIKEMNR